MPYGHTLCAAHTRQELVATVSPPTPPRPSPCEGSLGPPSARGMGGRAPPTPCAKALVATVESRVRGFGATRLQAAPTP